MIKAFNDFISSESLCTKKQKILLAVSGGVDSVVLLDLFSKSGYKIAIAHCNFQLRGEDSLEDEEFVIRLAEHYKVPCFIKKFDTIAHAKTHKQSIEMAARDLRYQWFSVLLESKNFDLLATGHHINDSIETFFLNLSRGTGINGLTGIPVINDKAIRPLLFATREQVAKYAKDNQISFRHDQSNDSTKFLRNIIRHQVIPVMKKINPSFEQVMERNIQNIKDASEIFNHAIDVLHSKLVKRLESSFHIDINLLNNTDNKSIVLYEIINRWGFNSDQTLSILSSINEQSGKLFYSTTHQLLIDRDSLIVEAISNTNTESRTYSSAAELLNAPHFNTAEVINISNFTINKKSNFACLDFDKISFPVKIRKWKSGDSFQPLGMKTSKKLSDFFIDKKLNRFDKSKVLVMISDRKIVWVMGMRIDNRFKVQAETEKVLILEI